MGRTTPNAGDVASTLPAISRYYASETAIEEAGEEGSHVLAGLAVTAGTGLSVSIAAGTFTALGLLVSVSSALSNQSLGTADGTNPKWVLVELTSAGAFNANAGTAAASPVPPSPTAGSIVLAAVYVPASATSVDTTIATDNGAAKIIDKRVIRRGSPSTGWIGEANAPTRTAGSATAQGVFTIPVDVTARYKQGVRVRWTESGVVKTGLVAFDSTVSTGTTTVTLVLNENIFMAATPDAGSLLFSVIMDLTSTAILGPWAPDVHAWAGMGTAVPLQFMMAGAHSAFYTPGLKLGWTEASTLHYGIVNSSSDFASSLTGVSSTIATSRFTKTAHGLFPFGQPVVIGGLSATTGTGLTNGAVLWVSYIDANTFQLSATVGGAVITLGGTADAAITISPACWITLASNTDHVFAGGAVSACRWASAGESPPGFPSAFNFATTWSGMSAPTLQVNRWWTHGRRCYVSLSNNADGTSSGTLHSLTLPFTAITLANAVWGGPAYVKDNGTYALGRIQISSGQGSAFFAPGITVNTASGACGIGYCEFWYEF